MFPLLTASCHGSARATAEILLGHGADPDWVSPCDDHTPRDAARRSEAAELAAWLGERGARTRDQLRRG